MKFGIARIFLLACLSLPLHAQDVGKAELARELGAMLAWRLSPGVVEEKCRDADPGNDAVRAQALETWQEKNAKTIAAVDARVVEVMAKLHPAVKPEDAVKELHAQVRGLLVDEIFAKAGPDEARTICKAESDPAGSRWNDHGMPEVQQSLATLYDWLVRQK
jgi:hypothetical protein